MAGLIKEAVVVAWLKEGIPAMLCWFTTPAFSGMPSCKHKEEPPASVSQAWTSR